MPSLYPPIRTRPGCRTVSTRARLRSAVMIGLMCAGLQQGAAQVSPPMHSKGLNVAPAYEGWEKNPDGSYDLVFGYMNRNWDDAIDIPIGPENSFEPGGPDRGQPTQFLPRRNYFVFRVRVPRDFGIRELVWTLTSNGTTERAYGTLRPGYALSKDVIAATLGAVGPGITTREVSERNNAPTLEVEGSGVRTASVGQAITTAAIVNDDGLPAPAIIPPWMGSPASSASGALLSPAGLRVAWFVYRGPGAQVTFAPPQFKVYVDVRGGSPWSPGWKIPPIPGGNRWVTTVTFHQPGMYILRCLAHDGAAFTYRDLTVNVR